MYRTSGAGDANVPALPVRRSAINRQSSSTPQLPPRHQTFVQQQRSTTSIVRPQLPASSSSSSSLSSSSRLNLANLDQRVDSSRSRPMNDYRDFPASATVTTTTTTTTSVRPGDSHLVSPSVSDTYHTLPPPLDVGLSWMENDIGRDDDRGKKTSKASECRESIICQRCGRCRCQECARHTATGRRAIEICSCVSCFRHVVAVRRRRRQGYDGNDDGDEDPCTCSPCRSDCRRRWALLVVLSICLPCLCFYWPLRCVAGSCSRCAGRQVRGCRCVESRTSELGRSSLTAESIVIDRVTTT